MKSYVERNKDVPMQKYKITKPGAKHARAEGMAEEGRPEVVIYGYPDHQSPMSVVGEIVMTDEDFTKYQRVLGLVPLIGTRVGGTPAPVVSAVRDVKIPADWTTLGTETRRALASQITGHEVKRTKEADKIIEGYLRGDLATDSE